MVEAWVIAQNDPSVVNWHQQIAAAIIGII